MPAVYTRTGDRGDTGLFGGSRVPKQSLRVGAYGTVDEGNAALGQAKAGLERGEWRDRVHHIQQRLFVLAAELASDEAGAAQLADRVEAGDVNDLEPSSMTASPSLARSGLSWCLDAMSAQPPSTRRAPCCDEPSAASSLWASTKWCALR